MNLQQKTYEDADGRPVDAEKVKCLAPYTFMADGFYRWTCGNCGEENSDRWWKVSGRVMVCQKCQSLNLLVRTDCDRINEVLMLKFQSEENKAELERLKGIEKYNLNQIDAIRRKLIMAVEDAMRKILLEEA